MSQKCEDEKRILFHIFQEHILISLGLLVVVKTPLLGGFGVHDFQDGHSLKKCSKNLMR